MTTRADALATNGDSTQARARARKQIAQVWEHFATTYPQTNWKQRETPETRAGEEALADACAAYIKGTANLTDIEVAATKLLTLYLPKQAGAANHR